MSPKHVKFIVKSIDETVAYHVKQMKWLRKSKSANSICGWQLRKTLDELLLSELMFVRNELLEHLNDTAK